MKTDNNQKQLIHPKRGDNFMDENGVYQIMAVADGYCMVRRKGKHPFIKTVKSIIGE